MIEVPRGFVKKEKLARHDEAGKLEDVQLKSRAEVRNREDGIQEVAIVAGKQRVVLNEFLPKGTRFTGSEGAKKFSYDPGRLGYSPDMQEYMARIEFPSEKLGTLRGRLSLLHEMGHGLYARSSDRNPHNPRDFDLLNIAGGIADSILKSEAYQSIPLPNDRKDFYLSEFNKEWRHQSERRERERPGIAPLRYSELASAIHGFAKMERASWAEALQLSRRIKKERGVDILDGADSKVILPLIEAVSLRSYEEVYMPLLELIGEDKKLPTRDLFDKFLDALERYATS